MVLPVSKKTRKSFEPRIRGDDLGNKIPTMNTEQEASPAMSIIHTLPSQLWNTDHPAVRDEWLGPFCPDYISNKPEGAVWTSSALRNPDGQYTSDWLHWCEKNQYPQKDYCVLLTPKRHLTIYEIDNREDFLALRSVYQKPFGELEPFCNGDKGVAFLSSLEFRAIDFAYYAQNGLDGFHVTPRGLAECSIWAFGLDDSPEMGNLSCWDVESACWFHMDWFETATILQQGKER